MACSVGAVILAMYVVQVTAADGDTLDLDLLKLKQTSIVYDINGDEYDRYAGVNNRVWCELSEIPVNLQNAVIAVEDKDFLSEPGVNFKRTIAAVLNELTGQQLLGSQQGASTLEQQLIKNLTNDNDTDYMRKVREIFRALGMARRYSKETVLEAYLNTIPLTGTIYGMGAGAKSYFNKDVQDLTLSECAVLASITKNPRTYNPVTNPESTIQRRNHVLYEMWQQGYITEAEYRSASAESITLAESKATTESVTRSSTHSYFSDALYNELLTDIMNEYGLDASQAYSEIYTGGLQIYSTVDPKIQTAMELLMLNEDDEYFPALWHEEEVETNIPVDTEVAYNDEGMPMQLPVDGKDAQPVFDDDDIPVYTDSTNTVFKTGTYTDSNGEKKICFYESVRTQAAMATLDYDGNVLALVGGLGEKKVDQGTNRAVEPHQTGSTMKPIGAYCLALNNHQVCYSSAIPDAPLWSAEDKKILDMDKVYRYGLSSNPLDPANLARNDIWRSWPTNYNNAGGKGDPMLVYDALRQSYNTVAVRLGYGLGEQYLYSFFTDVLQLEYLDEENDMGLASLVLGSQYHGLTTVELAGAYTMFNDGSYTKPHLYTQVFDDDGNIYLDNTRNITSIQAISQETAVIMNRMLQNVLKSGGTASGKAPDGDMAAAAKTGTTQNNMDYTFCGLTPYYVTAVWWGCDKKYDMSSHSSGKGRYGTPTQDAWKALMEQIQADLPYKEFFNVDTVVEKRFDSTGAISSSGQIGYYTEDNLPESAPTFSTDLTLPG